MRNYNLFIALYAVLLVNSPPAVASITAPQAYLSAHEDWSIQGERFNLLRNGNPAIPEHASAAVRTTIARNDYSTRNTQNNRTYITYTKTNPATNKVFTGRTSGFGSPGDILNKMDATHHMNAQGFGPAQLDRASNNKYVIRSQAKQLIKAHRATDRDAKSIDGRPQ